MTDQTRDGQQQSLRTPETKCIHRTGCPKPEVCGEVGHCTSMSAAQLRDFKNMGVQRGEWEEAPVSSNELTDLLAQLREPDRYGQTFGDKCRAADEIERLTRERQANANEIQRLYGLVNHWYGERGRLRTALERCRLASGLEKAEIIDAALSGEHPPDETCERRYVWQCSNPSCGQIWEADPHSHCPACLQSNGVGWSCICVFPRHLPAQKANDYHQRGATGRDGAPTNAAGGRVAECGIDAAIARPHKTSSDPRGTPASPNRADAIAALLDVAADLTDSERGMAADSLRDYARLKRSSENG